MIKSIKNNEFMMNSNEKIKSILLEKPISISKLSVKLQRKKRIL